MLLGLFVAKVKRLGDLIVRRGVANQARFDTRFGFGLGLLALCLGIMRTGTGSEHDRIDEMR